MIHSVHARGPVLLCDLKCPTTLCETRSGETCKILRTYCDRHGHTALVGATAVGGGPPTPSIHRCVHTPCGWLMTRSALYYVLAAVLGVLAYAVSGIFGRLQVIFNQTLPKRPASTSPRLRIACIGAASIAPNGLLYPARRVEGVDVVAIAARDADRAQELAQRWDVPKHGTYADILADEGVDAVYIALITGRHYTLAAAALRAGKHVLCEKPLTSNAEEARVLQELARERSLVLMEGYHPLHHPLAARMHELVHGGELGEIVHLEVTSGLPGPDTFLAALGAKRSAAHRPPKMDPKLGGGKFMCAARPCSPAPANWSATRLTIWP